MRVSIKPFAALFLSCFGFLACTPGKVTVGDHGPSSVSSTSGSATAATVANARNESQVSKLRVFFERVLADQGELQSVIAVSFASLSSTTKTPFGVALRTPRDFGANPIFAPASGNRVVSLRSNGPNRDSLVTTALDTMESKTLFEFPRTVLGFSIDPVQGRLAWVDGTGAVFIFNDLLTQGALSVEWNALGTALLVRTRTEALLYTVDGQTWELERRILHVAAAAFSPDGTRLAYVLEDRSVHVSGDAFVGTWVVGVLESNRIYDLSWKNSEELTYWARLSSGMDEIRVFDAATAEERTVVSISVPDSVRDGVVCPVWAADTLYFGDFSDGEYVIERARNAAGVFKRAAFAVPPAADEGFVCPKLSRQGASW